MTDLRDLDSTEGIALYTDGSCNYQDRSGGWAWLAVDVHGTTCVNSGWFHDTTNNQMELYAPTAGLSELHEALGPVDILIYSDSLYVVLGSSNRNRKRVKNGDWWTALDEAADLHHYVEWNHVKGHGTSLYNGIVDKMAGETRKANVPKQGRVGKSDSEYRNGTGRTASNPR